MSPFPFIPTGQLLLSLGWVNSILEETFDAILQILFAQSVHTDDIYENHADIQILGICRFKKLEEIDGPSFLSIIRSIKGMTAKFTRPVSPLSCRYIVHH